MLATIIKREISEYLRSSKFLTGLVFTLVLVVVSTLININDFKQRQQDYLNANEKAERAFRVEIFRKPHPLSILVQGKDAKLGNKLEYTYMGIPIKTSGYMGNSSQHASFFSGFSAVDFAFVVRVIFSLFVIFLAYNSVSEEKEGGTLKLALSNNLPRDQLLLGKFLGGLFVILGALLIVSVSALLLLLINPSVQVTNVLLAKMLLMFGISSLYLMCIYSITLFVSVVVNTAGRSLMVLLQIWIFYVVIYPNLSVIVSKQLITLPSIQMLAEQKKAAVEPYKDEFKRNSEAFSKMVRSGKRDTQISLRNIESSVKRTELYHNVDAAYSARLTSQMLAARKIALFSPSILYNTAMQRYASTDIIEFDSFMQGVFRSWKVYIDLYKLRYTDRAEARKQAKLNKNFTYLSAPLSTQIVQTLMQWIVLFFMTVLFFVLSYVKFLRKDVR